MKRLKYTTMILFITLSGCFAKEALHAEVIQAQQAKEMMEKETVTIVDVRTKEEYEEGHIPNAIHIPLDEISQIDRYAQKEDTLLIYCRSGNRSAKASAQLVDLGYEHVYDFGGIQDWPYEIEK